MSNLVGNPEDRFSGVTRLIYNIYDFSKLRHPHILTLMGVCQTNNLDGLVLIYERIGHGSLFNFLHQKVTAVLIVFAIVLI